MIFQVLGELCLPCYFMRHMVVLNLHQHNHRKHGQNNLTISKNSNFLQKFDNFCFEFLQNGTSSIHESSHVFGNTSTSNAIRRLPICIRPQHYSLVQSVRYSFGRTKCSFFWVFHEMLWVQPRQFAEFRNGLTPIDYNATAVAGTPHTPPSSNESNSPAVQTCEFVVFLID